MNQAGRPASVRHPLDLSATAIAAGVRSQKFSAEEVVQESLRRAHALQVSLNPFTLIREDRALASARRIDRSIADGESPGFLAGVPFAAKDLTPTAGDLTTYGSWTTGDWVPDETALCIRRLEAAGAILIGKTTTPEFAYSSFTSSPRWGVTRTPWDPSRTSGGSSGGSAVAVAGGAVPMAEGSDMGGSVRIPAAFCGVVGLKPSLGRIPMTILPSVFDNISHFGPLARTVTDAIAFMAATSGSSDDDIMSLPLGFDPVAATEGGLAGRRFALSPDLGYYAVEPDVQDRIYATVDRIRAAGATVDEVPLRWTRVINDSWTDIWSVFMSAYFGDRLAKHRDQMDPAVVGLIEHGFTLNATKYKQIELLRTSLWRDLAALFKIYDALLCPTCAIVAPSAQDNDDDYMADLPGGRFKGLDMTCPFNLVPQVPALSLPIGLTQTGLPVGLQIVGRRYADEDVLRIGLAVERVIGEGLCARRSSR